MKDRILDAIADLKDRFTPDNEVDPAKVYDSRNYEGGPLSRRARIGLVVILALAGSSLAGVYVLNVDRLNKAGDMQPAPRTGTAPAQPPSILP